MPLQLLIKLTQAWRVQRQQIQVIGGALLILLCLVFWERSQWTQPPPLDLLHDLPPAQPLHSSDAPDAPGPPHFGKSDPSTHWTCHNSKAWFQKHPYRWQELEELASLLCGFAAISGFQPGLNITGTDEQSVHKNVENDKNLGSSVSALVTQLQARVTESDDVMAKTGTMMLEMCQRAEAKSLWPCKSLAAASATLPEQATEPARSLRKGFFIHLDDGSLSFQDYQQGHPGKALLGLNGIMTAPRFFSFLLWLTNSPFAFFQARRRILAKFATAAFPLRTVMRLLRCPFSGVMIFLVSPGMQTMLYALAYIDQQPLLGIWVWLVGLASTAAELYCLHTAYYSPMILTEKIGSLICSQFILPFFNIFLSTCYMVLRPVMPTVLCNIFFLAHVAAVPVFMVWAHTVVWTLRLDQAALEPIHPAIQEGRRARNAFVAIWNAALEGRQLIEMRPGLPEGPAAAAAAAAVQDAPAREHRSRDRDHRHKEVHWPPPLIVPEHLEDVEVPDSFKCPITFGIMREPATTRSGLTYDRPAIMRWIQQHRRDPTTAQKLKAHHLSPNLSLRTVIQSWIDSNR